MRASPEDAALWSSYGRWLRERGDPLGERLLLHRELAASADPGARRELTARIEHDARARRAYYLGPALAEILSEHGVRGVELEWRHGVIFAARLDPTVDAGPRHSTIVRALTMAPAARLLTQLELGLVTWTSLGAGARRWMEQHAVDVRVRVAFLDQLWRWIEPGSFLMGAPEEEPGFRLARGRSTR